MLKAWHWFWPEDASPCYKKRISTMCRRVLYPRKQDWLLPEGHFCNAIRHFCNACGGQTWKEAGHMVFLKPCWRFRQLGEPKNMELSQPGGMKHKLIEWIRTFVASTFCLQTFVDENSYNFLDGCTSTTQLKFVDLLKKFRSSAFVKVRSGQRSPDW